VPTETVHYSGACRPPIPIHAGQFLSANRKTNNRTNSGLTTLDNIADWVLLPTGTNGLPEDHTGRKEQLASGAKENVHA